MLPFSQNGLDLDASALGRFSGIRVIADVHGAFDAFDRALTEAERLNLFVVQLGDLIDRGPYSPFCVERMLDVEARGLGRMLPGNHETAFARFVRQGTGGAVTRQATFMQFEEHGDGLVERYVSRIETGPLWITAPGHLFVHAAFHPAMLTGVRPGANLDLENLATHGYGNATERRVVERQRDWVDTVPKGLTVVVGHAVTASRTIETVEGKLGGRAVFADTGFWIDGSPVPVLDLTVQA